MKEIEHFTLRAENGGEVDSIYFGGGTPSLLPPGRISEMLDACRRKFAVAEDCEISLEANPETLCADKVRAYRKSGLNRISIGAQSFEDMELAAVGRRHRSAAIEESLGLLRKNDFKNVNVDLMLGLPFQTRMSWRMNLEKTAALAVPHISVYMLDLDDECPLRESVMRGLIPLPEEDLVSDLYLETLEFLSANGYRQYEISNFSLPGFACCHNLKYWRREPVFGYGLASHSFDGYSRYANFRDLEDYAGAISAGNPPVCWREFLNEARVIEETLFLGLRLNEGVNWRELLKRFGSRDLEKHEGAIRNMIDEGLLEWRDASVCLTPAGRLLSNEVFQRFL